MLSLFPELLFLAPFSALLIRVAAAVAFGYAGRVHISAGGTFLALGVAESVVAAMLFIGMYAQAAAIAGIVLFFVHALVPKFRALPASTGLLVLILCLSILVTGAGPLGFDLPL